MKIYISLIAAVLSFSLNVSAHQTLKDSILSDFNSLVKIVEDTHPDPYTNFGGRVYFHEKADEIRKTILASEQPTVSDLYELSSGFMAKLQDGHSFLNRPNIGNTYLGQDSLVVVKFEYVDGYLVVNAIDEDARHLLGSRLVGISSVPIGKVLEKIATFNPCENEAGRYNFMTDYFRTADIYRKITGHKNENITLQLVTPQGDNVSYSPIIVHISKFNSINKARAPKSGEFSSGQMVWHEVNGSMLFRLHTVMARENFEFQYKHGWDLYSNLSYYYRLSGKEMPADTLAAINSVPEISETFIEMLSEMKAKNINNLIIDLRGNGGGWTPIILPSLYMMFGDDCLQTDMEGKFYRRLSDLYLKKINSSLEQFNQKNHTAYKIGDYIMPEATEFSGTIEEKRNNFIRQAFCSDSVKEKLRSLKGKPLYRPENIYVVTNGGTFSAAFHYAFYLSKMGATIVGETSSQAPNCFMEVTPFSLPLTGLNGSVSNSLQAFLPSDDPKAKQFTPDIKISYEDYCRYDFDRDAILKYLLDSCIPK